MTLALGYCYDMIQYLLDIEAQAGSNVHMRAN